MSLGSVTSEALEVELQECINASENLLAYSKQPGTLILPEANMASSIQQAANVPLPPPSSEERQYLNNDAYGWNSGEILTLDEHSLYHQRMLAVIQQMKITGPVNKLPSPPKRKLREMLNERLGKKKKQDIGMTPIGLHVYLQKHIADMTKKITREKFVFATPADVNGAVRQLQDVYKHLNRQNAQSMLMNIKFGIYLNGLYSWFAQEKKNGGFSMSWDNWLLSYIDISASHARKLRHLAKLLGPFPAFLHLDLPLNEVLKRQDLFKEMLAIEQCANFWKQTGDIPVDPTNQSQ